MSALKLALWLFYLCCYSLALTEETVGQEQAVRVVVEEDSDAVLPCLISTKENITGKLFDWKKDGQKEMKDVFMYDGGIHHKYIDGVSPFQDQLKNGNASIKIKNVKLADSGNYTCIFPRLHPMQKFRIELVVERFLKDRSGEIPGASPKPHITTLDATKGWSLLQCEVQGASPKPKVEWKDSSGNILPAEWPQVSESGGRYYVTIRTIVTKTDHYRCEVTQEEISHQTTAETFVFICDAAPAPEPYIRILNATVDRSLLQCEVPGASPKPEVEWKDSSGNILPVEQHVSEKGGRHYVSILTTVTTTDHYRCEVTQREINHHIYSETHVFISGNSSTKKVIGSLFGGIITGVVVVLAVLVARKRFTVTYNQGPRCLEPDYKPPADSQSNSSA